MSWQDLPDGVVGFSQDAHESIGTMLRSLGFTSIMIRSLPDGGGERGEVFAVCIVRVVPAGEFPSEAVHRVAHDGGHACWSSEPPGGNGATIDEYTATACGAQESKPNRANASIRAASPMRLARSG